MTVFVPTRIADVTMHAGAIVDHVHSPGDTPDLDNAGRWAIECSATCENAVVSGFTKWADGDAEAIQGDGRVDVYVDVPLEVPLDEAEADPPSEPGVPVFNITVNVPKQKRPKRQKRQKRAKLTVETKVEPQITVEQPAPARITRVLRDKRGTVTGIESKPEEPERKAQA